jgi:hypothetical protein
MTEGHCGYTNFQTWCIAIAIHNNREALSFWESKAADCVRSAAPDKHFTPIQVAASALAEELQDEFEDDLERIQTFVRNRVTENLYIWRETCTKSYHGMDWVEALVDIMMNYVNESLGVVNWMEIARELIEGIQE